VNSAAVCTILVGPFIYQQEQFIPSIVIIRDGRFQAVIPVPSGAFSEPEFRRALTVKPLIIETQKQFFSPLVAALQQNWALALPTDHVPRDIQDTINANLASLPREQTEIVDASECLLLPGLIDIHTHFRTPGQEWKEDFMSGSRAALKGGITTIFDMPNNAVPVITQELLNAKKALARQMMQVNYGFYYGITDENVTSAHTITGHCGYKVFLGSSTGNLLITDWQRTLPPCFALGKPVIIHAEDETLIQANIQRLEQITVRDHPYIRTPQVAEAAIQNIEKSLRSLNLPPRTPIIVAHISTTQELALIRRLQYDGFPVLAEVTLHHLFLTLDDFEQAPHLLKTNPPIRNRADALAMQQAVQQNLIAFLSSDHAPHTRQEKESPMPPSGVPGMEYSLMLLFDAFCQDKLAFSTILNSCILNACTTFNLSMSGRIEPGYFADCTLLDPLQRTAIRNEDVQSKAGYSPFHGRNVQGRVTATFVNGQIGYRNGMFFPTHPRDLFR
jgi:dihydroorotase (multifunctional complex type)